MTIGRLIAFVALVVLLAASGARAQPPGDTTLHPAPDLAAFVGKPVTRVDVVIDDETWSDVVPPVVRTVKVGEPFTAGVARRAMLEVVESGRFAQGRAAVTADGAGVRVVVHAVQRKLIQLLTIDTHGGGVDRDEITRESELDDGGEILGTLLPDQKAKIKTLFVRHGYPRAEVVVTTRATDDPQKVLVYIDVQPGVPRLIDRTVAYVTGSELIDLEDFVLRNYAIKSHDRADEIALDAADAKLEELLRARGYHRADVSHDVIPWNGQTTLRIRVDTGPLFEPRFEGNDHYDKSALSGALDLANDTDRSTGHLVQKIRDFYAKRGFFDAEVSLETRGGDKDRVHFLVFTIHEHDRVTVRTRAYPCLKEDDVRRLREGGPRSASDIGTEIDSYLEEELPGSDLVKDPSPKGLDHTIGPGTGDIRTGARPTPIDLEPNATYFPDTYERALNHVQELYKNEGFLYAQVGPVQIVRRACHPRSPPGRCIPVPPAKQPEDVCTYDAAGLPLPVPPLDPALTCTPDPKRHVDCEPNIDLRIPVKLGPRTTLYDLGFTGANAFPEQKLAAAAALRLGDPVNTLKLDDARRRIVDLYKEEGYAYADVKYTLESSVDHTRARARFEITESEQVIVRDIVIRGNNDTRDGVIRRRIALVVGEPYRASLVRKTQERIATLNVFSSVNVSLADPYVPQKNKVVIVTLVERLPQHVEQQGGFTTGEGFYYGFEYGHLNIGGAAIGFSFRGRLSYLPTPLIIDPQVRTNFTSLGDPGFDQRIAARVTASATFPEIGLGPLVKTQVDLVFVHDLQRDFYITKFAGIPSVQYRPVREVLFTLSQSFEDNYVKLFNFDSIQAYFNSFPGGAPPDLQRFLLVPEGASFAAAQRFVVAWDRRDNSFNASRGTYFVSGLEHVDDFPVFQQSTHYEGHFLRFTETFAGYIPLPRGMRIAAELRLGTNIQLTPQSETYPDRLFFMGGVDSMRGWLLSSFVPQDDIDRIKADFNKPDCNPQPGQPPCDPKFTLGTQPVRGGNLMVNPRLELRVPLPWRPLETALFVDSGNLWRRATYPLDNGKFPLRASVGAGLRAQTPVGPIAVDYGVNVTRDRTYAQEDFGAFHFGIGLF